MPEPPGAPPVVSRSTTTNGRRRNRPRERIVDARPPASLVRREAEAVVGAEQRGEEAHPELGIATARREDEVEELFGGRAGGTDRADTRRAAAASGSSRSRRGRSEAEESLALRRRAGRLLARRDRAQLAEKRSSSARCRSSNCSSSRRRRSWKSSNAFVQRPWKRASASSTPRTMLSVGTKLPWQCGQ
jgi:hypothetical protein